MSEQEILEGNKLIADFMGINRAFDPRDKIYKYHSSWDWLIPVIDKIHSSDDYIKYKDSLGQFSCGVYINTKFINVTYKNAVDYIKWYNNQNKKISMKTIKETAKDYRTVQISQLERDIKIIQDILDGKIENYTQHPLPILREGLADYQNKLNKLQQENIAVKGGL